MNAGQTLRPCPHCLQHVRAETLRSGGRCPHCGGTFAEDAEVAPGSANATTRRRFVAGGAVAAGLLGLGAYATRPLWDPPPPPIPGLRVDLDRVMAAEVRVLRGAAEPATLFDLPLAVRPKPMREFLQAVGLISKDARMLEKLRAEWISYDHVTYEYGVFAEDLRDRPEFVEEPQASVDAHQARKRGGGLSPGLRNKRSQFFVRYEPPRALMGGVWWQRHPQEPSDLPPAPPELSALTRRAVGALYLAQRADFDTGKSTGPVTGRSKLILRLAKQDDHVRVVVDAATGIAARHRATLERVWGAARLPAAAIQPSGPVFWVVWLAFDDDNRAAKAAPKQVPAQITEEVFRERKKSKIAVKVRLLEATRRSLGDKGTELPVLGEPSVRLFAPMRIPLAQAVAADYRANPDIGRQLSLAVRMTVDPAGVIREVSVVTDGLRARNRLSAALLGAQTPWREAARWECRWTVVAQIRPRR